LKLINFPPSRTYDLLSWIQGEEDQQFWSGNTFQEGLNTEVFSIHLQRKDLHSFAFIDEKGLLNSYGEIVNSVGNKAVLCRVIVNPTIRRKGIGRKFVRKIVDWCVAQKKFRRITLNTFGHNKPARNCYRSLGFNEIVLKEKYRKVGPHWRDLVVMEKSLNIERI